MIALGIALILVAAMVLVVLRVTEGAWQSKRSCRMWLLIGPCLSVGTWFLLAGFLTWALSV